MAARLLPDYREALRRPRCPPEAIYPSHAVFVRNVQRCPIRPVGVAIAPQDRERVGRFQFVLPGANVRQAALTLFLREVATVTRQQIFSRLKVQAADRAVIRLRRLVPRTSSLAPAGWYRAR